MFKILKKKKQASPESKQLLHELEEVVQRLGYSIRYEKGDFEGGYCLLKESRLFVINTKYDVEKRIAVIVRNLKSLGINDIYVKPHIRELVESWESSERDPSESALGDAASEEKAKTAEGFTDEEEKDS